MRDNLDTESVDTYTTDVVCSPASSDEAGSSPCKRKDTDGIVLPTSPIKMANPHSATPLRTISFAQIRSAEPILHTDLNDNTSLGLLRNHWVWENTPSKVFAAVRYGFRLHSIQQDQSPRSTAVSSTVH